MFKNSLYLNFILKIVLMYPNRILAFSSSRVNNGAYLEMAVPFIKELLGDSLLQIAFIPFASIDNNFNDYTVKVKRDWKICLTL